MSNLIDFSLYDEATDGFFTVQVTASKAGELFLDNLKSARLIKTLKEQGQVPVPAKRRGAPSGGTGAVPKQPKAQWSIALTKSLLEECAKPRVRQFLRQKKVSLETYDQIAVEMNKIQPVLLTGIQVRERMRYLKTSFLKAKQSQNEWEYAGAMKFIFEAPLNDVSLDASVHSTPAMGTTPNCTPGADQKSAVSQSDFETVELPLEALQDIDPVQSPAKKKTTHGEAGSRTPRSTPRRKKQYQTEAWLPGVTHALLKECVSRKEQVQTGTPPTSLWKEVSQSLGQSGFACEWQACREKFESMNQFFEKSLLKVNGVIGQTHWPYYDSFLEIHDLPKGYTQPEDTREPNHDNEDLEDPQLWSSDKTIPLLISLYKERRHLFKSSKSCIRHNALYKEISAIMKLFNYDRSYKQCQRKMNSMQQYFKREFDRQNRTGEEPSSWEWFNDFMEMEKGSANLNAPFAFSTGAVTQYSIQGSQIAVAEERSTRTRITGNLTTHDEEQVDDPKSNPPKGAKVKNPPKKKLYKNWTQEVQEKSVQAKTDMVEEVRLLRLSQIENNVSKNEALKTMAEAMVNISAYCRSFTKQ